MMRALFFDNNLRYLTDYLVPEPGENEALIRVTCAGICNTDLEIVKGYMNFRGVPGHKFVGVVESCGNKALEGKRVVAYSGDTLPNSPLISHLTNPLNPSLNHRNPSLARRIRREGAGSGFSEYT